MSLKKAAGRLSLLILVATLWAAPAGAARPSRSTPKAAPPPSNLWEQVWKGWKPFWQALGCNLDPLGRCLNAPAPPPAQDQLERGCQIDPLGQCAK